jgi:hypothetical protein
MWGLFLLGAIVTIVRGPQDVVVLLVNITDAVFSGMVLAMIVPRIVRTIQRGAIQACWHVDVVHPMELKREGISLFLWAFTGSLVYNPASYIYKVYRFYVYCASVLVFVNTPVISELRLLLGDRRMNERRYVWPELTHEQRMRVLRWLVSVQIFMCCMLAMSR